MSKSELILDSFSNFLPCLTNLVGNSSCGILYKLNENLTDGTIIALSGNTDERKLGDSMTPLVKRVMQSFIQNDIDDLTHTDTQASTSQGRVKLNFLPVRLDDKVIGLCMIQTNIEAICDIHSLLNRYLGYGEEYNTNRSVLNELSDPMSLTQYMQNLIEDTISSYSTPVEEMSIDEKKAIVQDLAKNEVFFVRDSVRIASAFLGISVPTLYRLLKQ